MNSTVVGTMVVGTVLALGAPRVGAEAPPERTRLEALAAAVERSVRRVSTPVPAFLGSQPSRAYRVPGLGVFVVLPAHALPHPAGSLASATAPLGQLQAAGQHFLAPELRASFDRTLDELRTSLERRGGEGGPSAVVAGRLTDGRLTDLQREAERNLAAAARARADARRALSLAVEFPPVQPPGSAPAAVPPETVGPEALPALAPPPPGPVASDADLSMLPPAPSALVPDAAGVLEAVRGAVVAALAAHAEATSFVPAGESIAVTVDFAPLGAWPSPPHKTLVIRVPAAALGALARGAVDREGFLAQIEVTSY